MRRTCCMFNLRVVSLLMGLFLLLSSNLLAEDSTDSPQSDVASMSLEDLMNIEVTSVSKKEERFQDAPAAIYVLSREDIRRSGARSIPDLLRGVPGMQIAQVSGNAFSVSSRGGGGLFSNKLLVLIDGRSVYTPIFSGTFWDAQNVMLSDVERIEVIRGPGASLWGANAVNGVVNIVTQSAERTRGGTVVAGGGSYDHGFGDVRYGAQIGEQSFGRVYAMFGSRGDTESIDGGDAHDAWRNVQGGGRIDGSLGSSTYTLQGDVYSGVSDTSYVSFLKRPPSVLPSISDTEFFGGNILARWGYKVDKVSDLYSQVFWDRASRDDFFVDVSIDTLDLDTQYNREISETNRIIAGVGFRSIRDSFERDSAATFEDFERAMNTVSGFIQDEQVFGEESYKLIVGSKFEHNVFTGFEVQPNVRAQWRPSRNTSVWGAISRSVRTPSRAESGIILPTAIIDPGAPSNPTEFPGYVETVGNSSLNAERSLSYEMGIRTKPNDRVSIDISTFLNRIDDDVGTRFVSSQLESSEGLPYLAVQNQFDNVTDITAFGIEPVVTIQLNQWWRLHTWYAFLKQDDETEPGAIALFTDQGDAEHQVSIRSIMDLSDSVELDLMGRYVDRIRDYDIDSYTELNARLGWRVTRTLELALVGRNLLAPEHAEYASTSLIVARTEVPRAVLGQLEWKF